MFAEHLEGKKDCDNNTERIKNTVVDLIMRTQKGKQYLRCIIFNIVSAIIVEFLCMHFTICSSLRVFINSNLSKYFLFSKLK